MRLKEINFHPMPAIEEPVVLFRPQKALHIDDETREKFRAGTVLLEQDRIDRGFPLLISGVPLPAHVEDILATQYGVRTVAGAVDLIKLGIIGGGFGPKSYGALVKGVERLLSLGFNPYRVTFPTSVAR